MIKYSYVIESRRSYHYMRKREAIIVLAKTYDEGYILDCKVRSGKLHVDFFKTLIQDHEGPTDAAQRLMLDASILYGELEVQDPIYPRGGDIEVYHVFVATRSSTMDEECLTVDLETLIKYMELGVMHAEESKRALLQHLK